MKTCKQDDYEFGLPEVNYKNVLVGTTLMLSLILNVIQYNKYRVKLREYSQTVMELKSDIKMLTTFYKTK